MAHNPVSSLLRKLVSLVKPQPDLLVTIKGPFGCFQIVTVDLLDKAYKRLSTKAAGCWCQDNAALLD